MADKNKNSQIIVKLCFKLLPIQILLAAVPQLNGFTASLFASNSVGAEAMSAIALFFPLQMFFAAIGLMLFGGATILGGQYLGKNRVDRTRGIFSLSVGLSIAIAIVAMAALIIMSLFDLTGIFTHEEVVRRYLNQYMLGTAIGLIPNFLGQLLAAFLSLENRSKRTTLASVVYVVINIILNYIFVVVLHMEALGLALASSIGLWIFMLIEAQYFFTKKAIIHFSFKGIKFGDLKDIVRIGIPGALGNGYQTIRGIIVNELVKHSIAGTIGLSAFATANALLAIAWAIPTGMLSVSRMLLSVSTGEEDRQSVRDIMKNMLIRYTPIMLGIAVILCLLAHPLTLLNYSDTSSPVFTMTVWAYRIMPFCLPLGVISAHFVCYGLTMNKTILIHIISIVDGFVSVCFFTWLLLPAAGINGLYLANVLNGVTSFLIIVIYSVIVRKKFPTSLNDLLAMPDTFGVPHDNRIDITISSLEEAEEISVRVQEFCLSKGIDERKSYFAALAVEEIATNMILHGFTKDNKKHSIDIRIACKGERVIIRIKDDCIPFDPAEKLAVINSSDDPAKNIGIKMLYKIADNIKYNNIFGLNVHTIKF